MQEQSNYKAGELDGEVIRCFPNGNVMEVSRFENGKPRGYQDRYDIRGNLISRIDVH